MRERGYYWVKYKLHDEWTIGLYNGSNKYLSSPWDLIGSEESFNESDEISLVNPRRILTPDEEEKKKNA